MQITRENTDKLNAVVKINLVKEDYLPKVENVLKDYTKKVDLKGFRKGHVPTGIVKKMFGNQILVETLDKMLNDELNKFIVENKIEILGQPLPKENGNKEFDIQNPIDYEFLFELGLTPSFEVSLLSSDTKFNHYKIKTDDELLNEEIERIRKQFGKMTNPDTIEKDDTIFVELEELDANGIIKEGGVKNSAAIPLDMFKDKKLIEKILTLKKEDAVEINVFEVFEKDKEQIAKHFLGKEKAEGIGEKFKMTIKNINRVEKAELNQELFDKVYGARAVKSLEEFKEKLVKEYEEYFEQTAMKKLHNDMVERLLHETKVDFPDTFLKKWVKASNKNPITDEQIEKEYPHFVHDLKWDLIINKITKDNNIEIKREEVRERIKSDLRKQFQLYSKEEIKDDSLEQITESFTKNEEQLKKAAHSVMDDKIFALFRKTFAIERKEISLKEFNELK